MSRHVVTEADLHAYVDGVLPLARAAEVEAYLAERPEEAARLAA
jgi:anti-sigma factor RsiW